MTTSDLPEHPAPPVSVLVVDDEPGNRLALQAILASPEYRLVEAESAAEALRRLLDEDFALAIIDVVMPQMNGFELATAIKQRERTKLLPIIFLTAHATGQELMFSGYRVGAVDYLVKPLVPELVRAKVAVFVELYRQRKRIEEQSKLLVESQRKEHELRVAELRLASERRYRSLAEALPHIVWTAQPDGSIDYVNRRWFEYTGLSAELTASAWRTVMHPEDLPRSWAVWQDAQQTGQNFQAECRLRRADGDYRWHMVRAVPERGSTGQIVSWFGTFTDIDDQKRAHGFLAEFKGTLDAVLDAVLILDADSWQLEYVNRGARALFGYDEQELQHARLVDFLVDRDSGAFGELVAPLHDGAASLTVEASIRRKDGRVVPVELSLQLIHADGGRIVAFARDITERRRAQLERELLYQDAVDAIHARDEFLSVASHELRNPLTALSLQIDMLLGLPVALPPEAIKAKLQRLARQAEQMSRMISEMLDVSRIAAGRLHLELEDVDLCEVVREVVDRYSADATRAGCDVTLTAPPSLRGRWDRTRLEQVATNLLSNALKFGAGKPVEVKLEQDGALGRLTVSDHGVGIAPEDVERIFQRYEQAPGSRRYGGLGLGLYIVRQIVDAHGGSIRVESQPGAGSTFTVELPREARVAPEQPVAGPPPP